MLDLISSRFGFLGHPLDPHGTPLFPDSEEPPLHKVSGKLIGSREAVAAAEKAWFASTERIDIYAYGKKEYAGASTRHTTTLLAQQPDLDRLRPRGESSRVAHY